VRILILTRNFPPRACGVGDYASSLADALAAAGHFVAVLTEPAEIPRHLPIGLRERELCGWRDLKPILREIQAAAPDRVQLEYSGYAWGRWGVAWWLNALLFRLRRQAIPVHIGLHETAIRMRQHPLQILVALAQWAHIGMLLAAAETVALNMRSRVAVLGRMFPWWRGKLWYRPNSSNIAVVPITAEERNALRRERGVEDGESVVATFGMFHTAKHYEALVAAVGRLRSARSVRLWMLGDVNAASPQYVARLKALARAEGIEARVWWPGRLAAADVSRFLQAADLFVLPQADGHLTRSGAFMAAATHGLPVLAVRDATGRDQAEFTNGKNVWLVPRSSPEEIAAGIAALLGDPSGSRQMGENLRELYEQCFDWQASMDLTHTGGNIPLAAPARICSSPSEKAMTTARTGEAKP